MVRWFAHAVQLVKRRQYQGQVLILAAVGMTVLLGFVALGVDTGYALTEKRQVQTAVDAAAIAAANAAMVNAPDAVVISTAKEYGADNAGVSTDDVDVQRPPTSGAHAGDKNYIQVSINKDVPRFFTGAIYHGDWNVGATAMSAVVPAGLDAAFLALNDHAGGIKMGNSSNINVTGGGSIVSNYTISTSGNSILTADGWVAANQGIIKTGGSQTITAGLGRNDNSAIIPDPLLDKLDPPVLPAFPSNPITDVNTTAGTCNGGSPKPGWSPTPSYPASYMIGPGTYSGSTCKFTITGQNPANKPVEFTAGTYKFKGGAGITDTYDQVQIDGTKMIFDSGNGINAQAGTTSLVIKAGQYSFLNGAGINISGNAPGVVIGYGAPTTGANNVYYFSGGGGIVGSNSNTITLNPGTYIFDGGPGINMSGDDHLTFNSGEYTFYFRNGAGVTFAGSSDIKTVGSPHVKMYFTGSTSPSATWSDINMSGYTTVQLPSGEYYFDHGRVLASGSTFLTGQHIFFYFKNDGFLASSGQAVFSFTAPTTEVYPGYYPGVFMYSDRNNTATFTWTGSTSSISQGIIYLPASKMKRTNGSNGVSMQGQIIADSFDLSGNNYTGVQYYQYVATSVPKAYLVQ